ncbi:YheC/YheD family protein [Cohnella sp. CFH 77786]|uniref:YheC/YheD family endospore coat-associated protein n=1 Tax=Cohnella sp. CFH 77786 TaxID=2662265 RepID=UPI001C608C16|nr:YheC/YheD family protein [Cohnella sp. CFH 77786]
MTKRFGILQKSFPARGSGRPSPTFRPAVTWRLFHSAGKRYGLQVLFFRSEDVDFKRRRVHAWSSRSQDGQSGWRREWHPLPDVLYENYPVGIRGLGLGAKAVKRKFEELGIPAFNPRFFDKAELHGLLSLHPRIARYVPESEPADRASDLVRLLGRWGNVYLKPVLGYQGKGILEIRQSGPGRYEVRSSKHGEIPKIEGKVTLEKLTGIAGRLLKKRNYLAQQGLDLIRRDGRKIDFRVVVHRGSDGNWHTAGIRPKLGKPGSIVTNSHAGGSKTTWLELSRWASRSGVPLPSAEELVKPALEAARYLTLFRPTLSHLGIDVAVDRRRGIYLLDFNTVPGRDLLTSDMLRRVTDLTAGFASYLTARRP